MIMNILIGSLLMSPCADKKHEISGWCLGQDASFKNRSSEADNA